MPTLPSPLLDLPLAGRAAMGQEPIEAVPGNAGIIDAVTITAPYGRIGNNTYQCLNAALVARGLGARRLLLPDGMAGHGRLEPFFVGSLAVEPLAGREAEPCLRGSFFVPFGCEAAVLRLDDGAVESTARELCDGLFAATLAEAAACESTIAVAFRGGDVFVPCSRAPSTYVQPPAAFYLRAIAHARVAAPDRLVDLVWDDRTNPALSVVETALDALDVRFRSLGGDARRNLARLCAGETLVSCPSTFVDAAVLTSRRLRTLYSFRDHAFQSEFRPFMQWRLPDVLRRRGVEGVLIDDASRSYCNKWQWAASPAQVEAIRTFDARNLRLFSGL